MLGFADASQIGCAATTFLRVTYVNDDIQVYLLTCKTKVAPLKTNQSNALTISCLELGEVLLLAQLLQRVRTTLSHMINISRIYVWTDSFIVFSWLKADQKMFTIFTTKRICKDSRSYFEL